MTLFLVSDVAAALECSEQGARYLADSGACPPLAVTPGGVRVFDPATVARVKRQRARLGRRRDRGFSS